MNSWFLEGFVCELCEYEIVVTQAIKKDYRYYCSNLDCINHNYRLEYADQDDLPKFCRRKT